jgi:hypothetical protein
LIGGKRESVKSGFGNNGCGKACGSHAEELSTVHVDSWVANVAELRPTCYGIGKRAGRQAGNGAKSFKESIFLGLGFSQPIVKIGG